MPWKPIVAGVDATPPGARAGQTAWRISQRAGTECYLIHATSDVGLIPELASTVDRAELAHQLVTTAEQDVRAGLTGQVPSQALDHLDVRLGKPAWVLPEVARERDAGLLVLGGMHGGSTKRWIDGSTAHHAVRTLDIPVLLTQPTHPEITRVLVAVDLSFASEPTLREAKRFADLCEAKLKILHAIEPVNLPPRLSASIPTVPNDQSTEERLATIVSKCFPDTAVEFAAVRGDPISVLNDEVSTWRANILVVGTHGHGWVDPRLMGIVTEQLVNRPPTSLLVVPVGRPPDAKPPVGS